MQSINGVLEYRTKSKYMNKMQVPGLDVDRISTPSKRAKYECRVASVSGINIWLTRPTIFPSNLAASAFWFGIYVRHSRVAISQGFLAQPLLNVFVQHSWSDVLSEHPYLEWQGPCLEPMLSAFG